MTVIEHFDVSRSRMNDLARRANGDDDVFAELLVAEHFDVRHDRDSTDWFDARNPRNGTKFEVKSARFELADGATGRFRLWREQHRSLVAAASNEGMTAWYAFVLFSRDGQPLKMRRVRVPTVTSLVDGWNRAGHQTKEGRQHKLPWPEVFDE